MFSVYLWHGVYSHHTPKPQIWLSNDEMLLARLRAAAGVLSAETRSQLTGEPLVKRYKTADGRVGWSGDSQVLKQSQLFGCNEH